MVYLILVFLFKIISIFFSGIKLRTSLPNPLQLVSNHFNSMSKFLSATKYAIEHRAEDTVQLFQVNIDSILCLKLLFWFFFL